MKDRIKIHNCGRFYYHSICKVIHFQSFSQRFSSHEMTLFLGFLGPYSQKYDPITVVIIWRQCPIKHKQFLKNFSIYFASNETYPKFTVLVHFGTQFTHGKQKTLLKIKIPAKTAFLVLSNNINPTSQKNYRNLVKLLKNPFLGTKMRLNCTQRRSQTEILLQPIVGLSIHSF